MCQNHWSSWINRDKPDSGDGDREIMTPKELEGVCVGGKITSIECITSDGKEQNFL
jgi:hypothetical protein